MMAIGFRSDQHCLLMREWMSLRVNLGVNMRIRLGVSLREWVK